MMETKQPLEIKNNTFTGVHWDAKSVEVIQTVASALLNLTELFKSQNIEIETLLKINTDTNEKR